MKLIRNRLFLATVCIIASAICVYSFLASNNSSDIQIYKFSTNISSGTEITENMITSISVSSKNMDDAIIDKDEIIGMYLTENVTQGQFVFYNTLSTSKSDDVSELEKLDGEHIAYTITIQNSASSVASKVQAGDVVSIYINTNGESILPNELEFVEILYATTSSGLENSDNSEETVSTITLIVNKEQALMLNEYEYNSQIHLALVHRGDDELKEEYLSK